MIRLNPRERLTIPQILAHHWLKETNEDVVSPMLCNQNFEVNKPHSPTLEELTTDDVEYDWHYKYGVYQFKMANYSDSFNEFKVSVAMSDTASAKESVVYRQQGRLWLAKLALINNDFPEARIRLSQVPDPETLENYANYCFLEGMTYLGLDKLDSAELFFFKVLERDSTFNEALLGRGLIAYKKGNYRDAYLYVQKAFSTRTEINNIQYLKHNRLWPSKVVDYYDSIRKSNNALKNIKPLSEYPELVQFRLKVADDFYRKGDIERSRRELKEIFEFLNLKQETLPEDHLAALINFEGMLFNAQNKADSAILSYRKAFQIRKKDKSSDGLFYQGQTLYNIGNLFYKRHNNNDSAIWYYKKAIEFFKIAGLDISNTNLSETIKCYVNLGLIQLNLNSFADFNENRKTLDQVIGNLHKGNASMIFETIFEIRSRDLTTLINAIDEKNYNSDPKIAFGLNYNFDLKKLSDSLQYNQFTEKSTTEWHRLLSDRNFRLKYKSEQLVEAITREENNTKKADYLLKAIELNRLLSPRTDSVNLLLANLYNNLASYQPTQKEKIDATNEAIGLKEKLLKKDHSQELLRSVSQMYGNLGWYYLFTKEFSRALAASKKGLELYPKNEWINANLALGYLFTGRTRKALKIYKSFKDKSQSYNKPYKTVFLDDINDLENSGIYHKNFYDVILSLKE
jgi:lipoprotein NlpI